ncbi:hypothetical protein [Singulisphaera sp. PoT]|uniref:hypothetical protein n=1 Tax=Singulisphaera sp. PoT TaxID=3411797 RepID=UPI003BF5018B
MSSHGSTESWAVRGIIGSMSSGLTGLVTWLYTNVSMAALAALTGAIGSIVVPLYRIKLENSKDVLADKARIAELEEQIEDLTKPLIPGTFIAVASPLPAHTVDTVEEQLTVIDFPDHP